MNKAKKIFEDKSCQTDEDLIYNYAWAKFYHYFQQHANASTIEQPPASENHGEAVASSSSETKLDKESIKEIAESNMETNGFLYEPTTGLYYDTQNDFFYDQDSQLYLDIENRICYKYMLNDKNGLYQMRYHSKIDRSELKKLRKYLRRSEMFGKADEGNNSNSDTENHSQKKKKHKRHKKGKKRSSKSSGSDSSSSENYEIMKDDDDDDDGQVTDQNENEDVGFKSWEIQDKRNKITDAYKLEDRYKKYKEYKDKKNKSKTKKKDENSKKAMSSSEDENQDEIEKGEIVDLVNKYPPCIRAILIESNQSKEDSNNSNQLGSLFLVPYTGGTIGKSSKCMISFPKTKYIDNMHLSFEYDLKKKSYFVKDLTSKTGTFLNKEKLEPNVPVEIKHGDVLNLGESIGLLLHIHSGSITCINCEPGEVIEKFKRDREKLEKEINSLNLSKEETRQETIKQIKKKYGLKYNDFDKKTAEAKESQASRDRASERRNKVGMDMSHLNSCSTTEPPTRASVENTIAESNLGRKMLSKMGWKEGQGLGKDETGIVEPISSLVKLDNSGLGSANSAICSMDLDNRQKVKIVNWNKTKKRFQAANMISPFDQNEESEEEN